MSSQLKQRMFEYVDESEDEMVGFLCELISKKPVNPKVLEPAEGELQAQLWLQDKLEKFGFDKVDRVALDPKRPNLVGTVKGSGSGKSLILNGHCDVVPVTKKQLERWSTDPWRGQVKGGRVYGRGASDMLGGLTAIVWVARAFIENKVKLKGDLFVESVVGEESCEGGTIGAAATVDAGYRAPFAIVAEPSSLEIQPVTMGTFLFTMTVWGKDNHTGAKNLIAHPQRYGIPHGNEVGVDAIDKMLKYMAAFKELERNWAFRFRHPLLDSGIAEQGIAPTTLTTTLIEGGTYVASIPGYCKISCQVYYPPMTTAKDMWNEVKETVKAVSSTDDWLREHPPTLLIDKSVEGDNQYFPVWPPSDIPVDHEGCKAIAESYRRIMKREPVYSGVKAVVDTTWFMKKGVPAVMFGPGNAFTDNVHGIDESISIQTIKDCCKIYVDIVSDWCGIK